MKTLPFQGNDWKFKTLDCVIQPRPRKINLTWSHSYVNFSVEIFRPVSHFEISVEQREQKKRPSVEGRGKTEVTVDCGGVNRMAPENSYIRILSYQEVPLFEKIRRVERCGLLQEMCHWEWSLWIPKPTPRPVSRSLALRISMQL